MSDEPIFSYPVEPLKVTPPAHIGIPLAGLVSHVSERAAEIIGEIQPSDLPGRIAAFKLDLKSALTDAVDAAIDAAWAMKR